MKTTLTIISDDLNHSVIDEKQARNLLLGLFGVSGSVSVEDALAFAEYFRNNFDYCDSNANGRVYKWIDLEKRDQPAMTMKQIFDYWQSQITTLTVLRQTSRIDYLAGYSEAIRWRDPEVEHPENGEPVIVKYLTAKGIKKYGIAKYFELGIGNPWTIEGSTGREVIGWRPIE